MNLGPDKSGNRYGKWVAIREAERNKHGQRQWLCRCDCGNERVVSGPTLSDIGNGSRSCGCSGRINLAGKRFGRWRVIKYAYTEDGTAYWACICDCGKEGIVRARPLLDGSSQSCGCLLRDVQRKRKSLSPGEAAIRRTLSYYKSNARRRQLPWELKRDIFEYLVQQPCHYCGSQYTQEMICKGNNGSFKYTGLDRKDSGGGYMIDNVVPCCAVCNRAKMALEYEEFRQQIKMIHAHWASMDD